MSKPQYARRRFIPGSSAPAAGENPEIPNFLLPNPVFSVIIEIKESEGAMNLNEKTNGIEVFYDGRCGMCCSFHEWINRQPRAFGIGFIPYQAANAEQVFPGLGTLDPAREMVVRTDAGEVFRGAEAWVWCLYSCANHQEAARRLGGPGLLPVAVRACRVLAANRHSLSKVFFRRKDKAVRDELHSMEPAGCAGDFCRMDQKEKQRI